MKTGNVRAKLRSEPFVKTPVLSIQAKAEGNKIHTFIVTVPGKGEKKFAVTNGKLDQVWKKIQQHCKPHLK